MSVREGNVKLCYNFRTTGFCRFGSRCRFSHQTPETTYERQGTSGKLSKNVRVNLDQEEQKLLCEFLKLSVFDDEDSVLKNSSESSSSDGDYEGQFYVGHESSDDESTEDEDEEYMKILEKKYLHIPDSDFKRKFLENIMGNFRAYKGPEHEIPCALKRDPILDQHLYGLAENTKESVKYNEIKEFREQLPVYEYKDLILNMIEENQVIVISGETGSGKTTQVAQFILDDYIQKHRGSVCHIICTQPRRISAVSVAQRVADERGENCGESVGYQIRLEKHLPREQGSILYCTTGILLRRLHSDPGLCHVSHVLIDEIHERNMDTDFLMTIVREVLPQRKDLKVILMSATLNAEQFSKYFYNCPVIDVPGRLFNVQTFFLEDVLAKTGYFQQEPSKKGRQMENHSEFFFKVFPYINNLKGRYGDLVVEHLKSPKSEMTNLMLISKLIEYICLKKESGAILVFLSGWDQISELCGILEKSPFFNKPNEPKDSKLQQEFNVLESDEIIEKGNKEILKSESGRQFLILPLHSKMATVNQSHVFDPAPPGVRKIIIATNIAETSITINDVVYIIDNGKMKVRSYDVENNVFVLEDQWVSRANAKQRRGRAGRVKEGECYHLFTRTREEILQEFPTPEILRTRLEELILTIKLLELGKVDRILSRVLDCPEPKAVNSSLKFLEMLRALDSEENLTPLGFHLAKLRLDPHIAKMILLGAIFSCIDPILTLAACLSHKNPFITSWKYEKHVRERKIALLDGKKSDHLILIEAFRLWEECPSTNQQWKFCKENFISMITLQDLRKQKMELAESLYEMNFLKNKNAKDEDANKNSRNVSVLKAVICAGLYPNIATVEKVQRLWHIGKMEVTVTTPEDESVRLHKSSILEGHESFESPYLVYYEKMRSSQIFLYDATMISSLPFILFSHDVIYNPCRQVIQANKNIEFNCNLDLSALVLKLRKKVQNVLDTLIMDPGTVDWTSSDKKTEVLRQATRVITSEDTKVKHSRR